jgi:hypothetical protein
MPATKPPRRITLLKVPYNYEWPGRNAVTCTREPGEYLWKAEMADDAVAKGYAIEGWAADSTTRSSKGRSQRRRSSVTPKPDAATDMGSDAGMGGTAVAAAHRAVVGQQPASDAS